LKTVSLVILTWNRMPSVAKSVASNLKTAEYPIHEIVHVDNGSEEGYCDWFKKTFNPAVQVRHAENKGVAVGYNRGLALASGDYVVITGCDRIMPQGWLKTWMEHYEAIPNTGTICCLSTVLTKDVAAPFKGSPLKVNGKEIIVQYPMEARICSKEFLFGAGFFREDFGLYGYEDAEWANRADRYAKEKGLINYMIPALQRADYLTCEDFEIQVDGKDYWQHKQDLHKDPRRKELFVWCRNNGNPYYNPYSQVNPNLLGKVKA